MKVYECDWSDCQLRDERVPKWRAILSVRESDGGYDTYDVEACSLPHLRYAITERLDWIERLPKASNHETQ